MSACVARSACEDVARRVLFCDEESSAIPHSFCVVGHVSDLVEDLVPDEQAPGFDAILDGEQLARQIILHDICGVLKPAKLVDHAEQLGGVGAREASLGEHFDAVDDRHGVTDGGHDATHEALERFDELGVGLHFSQREQDADVLGAVCDRIERGERVEEVTAIHGHEQ